MKFSTIYSIYPDNKALESAIEHYQSMLADDVADNVYTDNSAAIADIFIYTRGNYEQRRYNANVFANAREVFEAALTDDKLRQFPLDWAKTQNSLGNILAALGQQKRDVDLFYKAIASFHSALEILTQESSPLAWAATQSNLGTAMQALGRQESDSKLLKSAIDAYTAALLEYTRKETPEDWSIVMFQLGATLHEYGSLLKGNRTFQKSVVAYKNALAELDADLYALELAATHNNRAAVLHHLAESEENADRMNEAIRAYETALTVCMEQQLPIHLAVICRVNKATAKNVLATLSNDAVLAEENADEFELILACFTDALQPLCIKHCEEQLGKAKLLSKAR